MSGVGQYDPARRRQAVRKGRERGAWIFIPASELEAAGVVIDETPPWYRVWPRKAGKRTILVQLYKEP